MKILNNLTVGALLLSLAAPIQGQENLSRKVSYTLGQHEIISSDEYFVGLEFDEISNMLIVKDTLHSEYKLVVNNEVIFKNKNYFSVEAITFRPSLKYFISVYVDRHELIYDENGMKGIYDYFESIEGTRIYYFTKEDNMYWVIDDEEFGPFTTYDESDEFYDTHIGEKNANQIDSYRRSEYNDELSQWVDESFIVINNDTIGPFEGLDYYMDITNNGEFFYIFNKGDSNYIQHNNNRIGPFAGDPWRVKIADNNHITYTEVNEIGEYSSDEYYVHVDNQIFGPFDHIKATYIDDKGQFCFYYEKDGKNYQNVNGEAKPTHYDISSIYEVLNIDGNGIVELIIDENGYFPSHYKGDKVSYKPGFAAGKYELDLYSADLKHHIHTERGNNFVVIDGSAYGKCWPLRTWYDLSSNSFYWYGMEGQELVIYSYKL